MSEWMSEWVSRKRESKQLNNSSHELGQQLNLANFLKKHLFCSAQKVIKMSRIVNFGHYLETLTSFYSALCHLLWP